MGKHVNQVRAGTEGAATVATFLSKLHHFKVSRMKGSDARVGWGVVAPILLCGGLGLVLLVQVRASRHSFTLF